MNWYNEIEPYAANWLRNLCDHDLIAPGRVDERSIRDLTAADVAGPGQRHFFAGIGGWSLALRMAGWPDELAVWTGSCPCQPFSVAGKRAGTADDRHLWPAWFELIDACRPPVIFGEQVASKDALAWLDLVFADLEGTGYTCWAADLCAAGVGAPHIRQRLWWVAIRMADGELTRLEGHSGHGDAAARWPQPARPVAARGESERLADDDERGRTVERAPRVHADGQSGHDAVGCGEVERLGHAGVDGTRQHARELSGDEGQHGVRASHRGHAFAAAGAIDRPGPVNGQWRDADWLYCRDDRWRPVEPGSFPLADGIPGRVGRLRAYGNAIVPAVAAEFVRAVADTVRDRLVSG